MQSPAPLDVLIVGAGVGGLTLALCLHEAGIRARVCEASPEIRPLGVGINVLPHATRELGRLGLEPELTRHAVLTREDGLLQSLRPADPPRAAQAAEAGYESAAVLDPSRRPAAACCSTPLARARGAAALRGRAGAAPASSRTHAASTVAFRRSADESAAHPPQRADVVIACDGLHSDDPQAAPSPRGPAALQRRQHVARGDALAAGSLLGRDGWFSNGLVSATAKMVIYPIRNDVDGAGRQLVNWVRRDQKKRRRSIASSDWNRPGRPRRLHRPAFADWHFDWLDVPALITRGRRRARFPMVDRAAAIRVDARARRCSATRPTRWCRAAPTAPRQAILDARSPGRPCWRAASRARGGAAGPTRQQRLAATTRVVLTEPRKHRPMPSSRQRCHRSAGDRPFEQHRGRHRRRRDRSAVRDLQARRRLRPREPGPSRAARLRRTA